MRDVFGGINLILNRKNKSFLINIFDQIKETVKAFGKEVEGLVKSPTAKYLFNIPEHEGDLDKERKECFHTVVAKMLFIINRAKPDLEAAITFLWTNISSCKMSYWEKIKRIL